VHDGDPPLGGYGSFPFLGHVHQRSFGIESMTDGMCAPHPNQVAPAAVYLSNRVWRHLGKWGHAAFGAGGFAAHCCLKSLDP
jgi:hypothetical protein